MVIKYVEQLITGVVYDNFKAANGGAKKIKKISLADIGVVSAYRGQCALLTYKCKKRGWDDLKIGTVELFQGDEKPVIIATTVLSNMSSAGFLSIEKVCWI